MRRASIDREEGDRSVHTRCTYIQNHRNRSSYPEYMIADKAATSRMFAKPCDEQTP